MVRSRIILNGTDLDLSEDVSMPLNYCVADVREPEKKNTNFSKEIKLPGTIINDKMFGRLFDVNVLVDSDSETNYTPSFDPNLKADCQILFDGAQQFKGFMQLVRIEKNDNNQYVYVVNCFGKLKDLFYEIGEKTLSQLDLSKYNHPYTQSQQIASWASSIKVNGVTVPFSKGTGYVYPMIDHGLNNDVDYKVSHFFPSIYLKTITDEIINQAGFQYDCDFFNTDYYKSLIVPFTSGNLNLTNSQVANRTHRASLTSTYNGYSSGTTSTVSSLPAIVFQDETTNPNHDAGGVYNNLTGKETIAFTGNYKFNFNISACITHFPSSSPANISNLCPVLGFLQILKTDATTGGTTMISQVAVRPYVSSVFYANEFNIQVASPVNFGDTSAAFAGVISFAQFCNAGDQIYCTWQGGPGTPMYNGQTMPSAYSRLNILSGSYFESQIADVSIHEGDTVDMTSILSDKIKQKDLLSSVFKIANIYSETDKDTPNKLLFEPRNDYYNNGVVRYWPDKLDHLKQIDIQPMGALDARTYRWTWKPDDDYWNKTYTNETLEVYGQRRYDVNNDFINQEKVIEVIFSPTPLVDRNGSDRVIPRIYQVGANGVVSPKAGNIRLLYYGGVKTTATPYNYIASSGTTVMSSYAYAGHLDDVSNPSYDINFGVPKKVYYTAQTYGDNTIFNEFSKQFIDEITDKDSKIFIGYFNLSPYDISILDFRDKFFFEKQYWILNRVIDYDPIQQTSTKCEFLKLKAGVPFIPTKKQINGGQDSAFANSHEAVPIFTQSWVRDGNSYSLPSQYVTGINNIVDPTATGVIVSGERNAVGANCRNINLLNTSGCCVYPGLKNFTAINCANQEYDSTYENKIVIYNVVQGNKSVFRKTSNYTILEADSGRLLVCNRAANNNFYLPEVGTGNLALKHGFSIEVKSLSVAPFTTTTQTTDGKFFEDGVSTTNVLSTLQSATYTWDAINDVWLIT